jgi:uncharacterized membrane protein
MPAWVHEWIVAPVAFGLAFRHAARALGAGRATVELAALAGYGFALEWVAIAVFASHRYGAAWSLAPLGVPLAIAIVWAAVITSGMALAVRAGARSAWRRAALAAALGIALDLMMEPVAVRLGLWEWTPRGPWLAVPIGNFVGWAVIVGGYTYGAEHWAAPRALARDAWRRAALAAAAIGALVAVGLLWTHLGAERLFDGGPGWVAWAILTAAGPILLRARPARVGGGPTLASALGDAAGLEPVLVFAIVGGTFAIDAASLGQGPVGIAAAGSVLSLGWCLARTLS